MAKFTEIVPSFWVLKSKLYQFNSGILEGDKTFLLIDPGIYPAELKKIAEFVEKKPDKKLSIIITHSHWDHILGPEYFPDAQVMTHEEYLNTLELYSEGMLKHLFDWEKKAGISREGEFLVPLPDVELSHEDIIVHEPFSLKAIYSPGHARDQVALYDEKRELLWSADMLSDIEIPYVCDNLKAYIKTLEYVQKLSVKVHVPGHGNWSEDPARFKALVESDLKYLKDLEGQVLSCVENGLNVEDTVKHCAAISLRVDTDLDSHAMNVETVFVEFGGKTDGKTLGWAKYVETAG